MKKGFLLEKIKKLSFKIALFLCIPAFFVATMLSGVLAFVAMVTSQPVNESPVTVLTSVEQVESKVAQTGYFALNLEYLEYYGSMEDSGGPGYSVYLAAIAESDEGVIVRLQKNSIADAENPPALYQLKKATTDLDYVLTDAITKDYCDGSNEVFSTLFSPYVVTEAPILDGDGSSLAGKLPLLYGGASLVMLILMIFPARYFVFCANPKMHKAYKNFAKSSGNVTRDLENMDVEVSSKEARFFKNPTITKSWVVHSTFFRLFVHRMDSIIWVYLNETTTSNHYASYKSYGVYVCDQTGTKYLLSGKNEKEACKIFETIQEFNPYAEFGFSVELEQKYINKRSEMIRQMKERQANGF